MKPLVVNHAPGTVPRYPADRLPMRTPRRQSMVAQQTPPPQPLVVARPLSCRLGLPPAPRLGGGIVAAAAAPAELKYEIV